MGHFLQRVQKNIWHVTNTTQMSEGPECPVKDFLFSYTEVTEADSFPSFFHSSFHIQIVHLNAKS